MKILKGGFGPDLSNKIFWGYLHFKYCNTDYTKRSFSTIEKSKEVIPYIKRIVK